MYYYPATSMLEQRHWTVAWVEILLIWLQFLTSLTAARMSWSRI